jgi:hypothetical protein
MGGPAAGWSLSLVDFRFIFAYNLAPVTFQLFRGATT